MDYKIQHRQQHVQFIIQIEFEYIYMINVLFVLFIYCCNIYFYKLFDYLQCHLFNLVAKTTFQMNDYLIYIFFYDPKLSSCYHDIVILVESPFQFIIRSVNLLKMNRLDT